MSLTISSWTHDPRVRPCVEGNGDEYWSRWVFVNFLAIGGWEIGRGS